MEIIIQLLRSVPAGWPRVLVVVGIVAVLGWGRIRHLIAGGKVEEHLLARARRILEVRRLQLQVDSLKKEEGSSVDSDMGVVLDASLNAVLAGFVSQEATPPLPWRGRLRYAGLGAGAFLVITLVLASAGRMQVFDGSTDLLRFAFKELAAVVPCAFVASALPSSSPRTSALFGFGLPVLLGAIAALVR